MNVFYGFEGIAPLPGSVVAIGVFDGVHLGHQALIRRAVERARALELSAVAITFDAHPLEVLRPEEAPKYLCSLGARLERIGQLGVDYTVVAKFDRGFASLEAEEFVETCLQGRLSARVVVCGSDFRFGARRAGDIETIKKVGIEVDVVEDLGLSAGTRVSSSDIRRLVAQGSVEEAQRHLGWPVEWVGTVVRGAGNGRKLGWPTANLVAAGRLQTPGDGVYAGEAWADGALYKAAISVGHRPMFPDQPPTVEAHLLNFDDANLYGRAMVVRFHERLRDQMKFDDLDELRIQIGRDVDAVRAL